MPAKKAKKPVAAKPETADEKHERVSARLIAVFHELNRALEEAHKMDFMTVGMAIIASDERHAMLPWKPKEAGRVRYHIARITDTSPLEMQIEVTYESKRKGRLASSRITTHP